MSAYDGVSVVLLPFSIVLAACTLPRQWRALRAARDADERRYWRLTAAGHALASLGLLVSSIWMFDRLIGGPLHGVPWWPSPSRLLNMPAWGDDAALADVLLSLGSGLLAMLAASYFGYVDELGQWCRPPWRSAGARGTKEDRDGEEKQREEKSQ